MRILIVDDEPHLRRMMRLTLEATGYEVEEAANGEDALRLFGDGRRFDATLLDQRMPGSLDGLETLRRMKLQRAGARVVMVTAYATIDLAVEAMKLGASDFVRKPMTPGTLRHALDAALAKPDSPTEPGAAGAAEAPVVAPTLPAPPMTESELWTTNGFFIRRVVGDAAPTSEPGEHHFIVKRGRDAAGSEVVVVIDPATVKEVARECERDLSASGAFWRRQTERALVNFLWSEAALPPDGRLVIDRTTGSMIDAATVWAGD